MLRRLHLLLILFVATSALVAAEVSVSDFALRTAPGSKRLPTIAAGDSGYLAAWLDERSWGQTLIATRISPTGEPLEVLGIPLGRAGYFRPQVVWNGSGYLVFWNDPDNRLMVASVSRDGVAGSPRVVQEHARLDQRSRAVATNGTNIVLAYSWGPMHVAVLTRDGVLIDDRIIDGRASWTPTVVANGHEFLVAWSVQGSGVWNDFVAMRLDSRGAPIDDAPRKIGAGWDSEILRNGSNYVAVAQAPDSVSWSVSRDLGTIGTTAPLPLNHYDRAPSLLDGSPAMMAVFESSEKAFVTAVTFDGNGHEAGPRKRIVETVASHFAVTRGNDALAMIEVGSDGIALNGSLFDDATLSRKAPDRALALSAAEETAPAVAGGGGRYLAVWQGPQGLTAGRFLPDGTRLDASGFVLDSSAFSPAVAFDGERFVVSYILRRNNRDETIVRFVSPYEGLLPDGLMVASTVYVSGPATLAAGGGVVLATWTESGGIYAALLQGTRIIAPARKIASSEGGLPAAQWNGRQFLVVWTEYDFDYDMSVPARLRSMRIDSDLTLVDAQPRRLLELSTELEPVLGAWKGGWLIAFQDGNNIRLHEIDESGAMKETPLVTTAGYSPKLVNATSHPWLAWTSYENETLMLRVAPVRSDGTLGTDAALSVAAPPFGYSFGYSTAIGSLGNHIGAVYARVAPEAGSVRRVFLSAIENESPGRRRAVR
jgi:hypothetical protein